MRRPSWIVATTSIAAAVALAAPGGAIAAEGDGARAAQRLGAQLVPKQRAAKSAGGLSSAAKGVNPFIGLLPDPAKADYAYWKSAMKQQSAKRAAKRAAAPKALAAEPLLVDEDEPDGLRGGNDTFASAQLIPAFGTGAARRPAARILGTLAPPVVPDSIDAAPEDNGSIPLTGETELSGSGSATTTDATVGDGPHGSDGDGTGDFDFYAVRDAAAGQRLLVDIDTPTSALDSMVLLYDDEGNAIAFNDDQAPGNFDSLLIFVLPAAGDYYVSVQGFANFQDDPLDSGSGDGAGSEGDYTVTFGLDSIDVDTYAVDLRAGDVLGGSLAGSGTLLSVNAPGGRLVFGSNQDASFIYPPSSPLPGGGNAVADHVVGRDGRHYLTVIGGQGNYDLTLEVYRPGPQAAGVIPTLFLDFDGQRVNTGIWDGPGVRQLSPLRAFLGRWGIPAGQYDALQNRIVNAVIENVQRDFAAQGVRVLNSRDHADPFGQPGVSRLIVGGTIAESGIETIGIAQSIDPGNFETEETALILLDFVSGPASRRLVLQPLPPAHEQQGEVRRYRARQHRLARGGPLRRELARRSVQQQAQPDGPGRELPAALRRRPGRHRRHRGRPGRRLRQGRLQPRRGLHRVREHGGSHPLGVAPIA